MVTAKDPVQPRNERKRLIVPSPINRGHSSLFVGSNGLSTMWRSSVEAGRNSKREADGLMWGAGALEGLEILVNCREELGLTARRRLAARLLQIFPRLLPLTRSPVGGSESVEVRRSARI